MGIVSCGQTTNVLQKEVWPFETKKWGVHFSLDRPDPISCRGIVVCNKIVKVPHTKRPYLCGTFSRRALIL